MMKKTIYILALILVIILFPLTVNAAGIDVKLTSEEQEYSVTNETDTINLKISLGDFVNIQNGIVLGCTAILDYDSSIIEEVTVTGENCWNVNYNKANNKILCDTNNAMPNTEIATIELKLNRQQINGDKQTKISLNNIELSDGEFKITSQKSVTVNLKNNKTDSDIAQKVSDIKIIAGEKAINTTVSQRNNEITLPNAGNSTWLVVIIVILILLMILFKFKSRKIKY